MQQRSVVWETKFIEGGTWVFFTGDVDERSDFDELTRTLKGSVTFDLAGVRRLNSEGVRRWIKFVGSLQNITALSFVRCSIPVVTQMNLIKGFVGAAQIRSFYAPFICEAVGKEEQHLLTPADVAAGHPPTFPCEGGVLELDDVPERYFAFLNEAGRQEKPRGGH
jgi:eukaryotic-like serine/threonine-protein kinase